MNKFLLAIPALCDFIASTLNCIALNFIAGSVYQMIRGGTIVTTFIFSIIFFKTKIKKNQSLGALMAFFGVFIVGASNLLFSAKQVGSADVVILNTILGASNNGICFNYSCTFLHWVLSGF